MKKKRTVVDLLDDFDGSPNATTVDFALDGIGYEIELSEANAAALREALAPYIERARRRRGGRRKPTAARPTKKPTKVDPAAVREWARDNGIELSKRGRIPDEIVEQYLAAA